MRSIANIKVIGVIGSGTMGSGIASAAVFNGFKVLLYDINESIVKTGIDKIKRGFDKLVEKKKIDITKKEEIVKRLIGINKIEELSVCDFVIEAAIEDIALKKELFTTLEKITGDDIIFTSNTSSLSVTAISTSLNKEERFAGMHFFNPANVMKLVEVIRGEFTSDEVLNTVIDLSKKLGKIPVVCSDTPAFIVNRVARAFYGEALKIMSEEMLKAESIDTIMKDEGGFAMGPFELMDLIGIDVNL
ncbi:MAG TPA: 3-hydroxyacyl-CoA dehydrogenase NAD-binding domain-containing protein, partial [Ignavibacteria bacterium]|nr:3-hydroxyacyl-CoA dehydrogenase NAD-binding domain-containing protein [Ignavibacteria bacterium]